MEGYIGATVLWAMISEVLNGSSHAWRGVGSPTRRRPAHSDTLSRSTVTAAGSYRQAFDPATYSRAARDAQDRIDDIKIPCAHSLCQAQGVVLVVTSAAAIHKRDLPKISCVTSWMSPRTSEMSPRTPSP